MELNLAGPLDNAEDFSHSLLEVAGARGRPLDSKLDCCGAEFVKLAAVRAEGGQVMNFSIDHMNCISTSSYQLANISDTMRP